MFRKKEQPTTRRKPVPGRNQSAIRSRIGSTVLSDDGRRQHAQRHNNNEKLIIKKKTAWRMLPSFIALSIIILSGIYTLHLDVSSARVRIAEMGDNPNQYQVDNAIADQEAYQKTLSELLRSSMLNKTKLTVRSGSITANFKEAHPEVAHAEIRYGIVDNTPILSVILREPHLVIRTEDAGGSYIIDVAGVAFAQLANAEPLDDIPYVEDSIGTEIELGQQVLPSDTIDFIDAVLYQLQSAEYAVETLALPAVANEMHIRLTGDEFVGKFDITGNPRLQTGSFIATRNQLSQDNELPGEYIDVRVSGRAYYR